jgi:O-antigen ligase
MKLITDFKKVKPIWLLILITVAITPFSSFSSVRLWFFLFVISFFWSAFKFKLAKCLIESWDVMTFNLVLMFGLIYSENMKSGWGTVETSFTLIALPFIFSRIERLSKHNLYKIFYAFIIGLILTSLILLCNPISEVFISKHHHASFSDRFAKVIGLDSTYLSYYLIFAITFGLYLLYFEEMIKKVFIVPAIIFFFIVLALSAGNTAFVSMLLVLAFFVLKFLIETERTKYKIIVFSLAVFFLASMFYFSYFDLISFEGRDYWERFVLWEAAIKATPNLFLGVGTGDYTSVLNNYYRSHNLSQFSLSNYNAHNQFIQIVLSNGILGLIALLTMMIRPLVLSIRYQNLLGILVFFSFFIYGQTEVFLGRYQGVVFFALMHQSFISYYRSQSKGLALKES